MAIDKELLEILACPECRTPVAEQTRAGASWLTCGTCGRWYPVRDGIPVMLLEEALREAPRDAP